MLGTRLRPPPPPAPAKRRFSHPGWTWASAILVALIAAAAVFVVVHGRGSGDPAAAPAAVPSSAAPARPTAPAPAAPTTVAQPAACPSSLPAENQARPRTAPDAQWIPVGRMQVPYAAQTGPIVNDGGVFRCYARTPVGALFAATGFLAALSDPDHLQQALAQLTAPGPGRDVLVELAAINPVAVTGVGQPGEVRGFTFLSTGLGTTAVSLVIRADNGGMVAAPITLTWDGDWRVVVPEGGDLTALAAPVTSLDGFVPFGAGS